MQFDRIKNWGTEQVVGIKPSAEDGKFIFSKNYSPRDLIVLEEFFLRGLSEEQTQSIRGLGQIGLAQIVRPLSRTPSSYYVDSWETDVKNPLSPTYINVLPSIGRRMVCWLIDEVVPYVEKVEAA